MKFIDNIKYKITLNKYLKKIDYKKIHFYNYLLNYLFKFLKIVLILILPLTILILDILWMTKVIEFSSIIVTNKDDTLANIAFTAYGFQIAILTLMLSIKNNKIFNESVHKMMLSYSFYGLSLRYIIVYSHIYLILLLINVFTGATTAFNSLALVALSVIAIIVMLKLSFMSISKLYYKNKNIPVTYIFLRRKGNFPSYVNDYKVLNTNQFLKHSNKYKYIVTYNTLEKISKEIHYNTKDIGEECELFKLQFIKYMPIINNDTELYLLSLIINQIDEICNNLYKNEKYEILVDFTTIFLDSFIKLLNKDFIKNRFLAPDRLLLFDMSMKNSNLFKNIAYRNFLIIDTIKNSYSKYSDEIKTMLNGEGFYEADKDHLFKKLKESDELVEKLNNDVSKFLNSIDDLGKAIKQVLDIINKSKKTSEANN